MNWRMFSLCFIAASLLTATAFSQSFLSQYKGSPYHDTRYSGGPQKIPGKVLCAYSGQARFNITALNTNSRLLLENYGGFLPRQGHEYAEQMKEAAAQMERLRQDLVGSRGSESDEKAA